MFAALAPPTAAQEADWRQDWERPVATAKREGTLDIAAPAGRGRRDFPTEPFQKSDPEYAGSQREEMEYYHKQA